VFVNLTAPPLWIESRCHALAAWGAVGDLCRSKTPPHSPHPPGFARVGIRFAPRRSLAPPQKDQQGKEHPNEAADALKTLKKTSVNTGRNHGTFSHFLSHFAIF
jgi:hypothetical protein